jgi:hypothetical protein
MNTPMSMPHMIVGGTPQNSERLFSSGNERTHAIFPQWGENDVGYKLKSADKFSLIVDLMNENVRCSTLFLFGKQTDRHFRCKTKSSILR